MQLLAHQNWRVLLIISALSLVLVGSNKGYAQGINLCDESVREFSGGHGRGPGPTIVKLEMRQFVRNFQMQMVEANSDDEIAFIEGDEVTVLLKVKNNSIYDVANVMINHIYKAPRDGPEMESIVSVMGGAYEAFSKTFRIERIPAGEIAELSFRIFLHGELDGGVSQNKLKLEDFVVLGSERRFPQRTPENAGRTRQNIERVGIGGIEVSCFTGHPGIASVREVSDNPPMEYEAYTGDEPMEDAERIPLTANVRMLNQMPVSADVPMVRDRDGVSQSVEQPAEISVPQTGVEMSDLIINMIVVVFGVVIGFGVYGVLLRWMWRRY